MNDITRESVTLAFPDSLLLKRGGGEYRELRGRRQEGKPPSADPRVRSFTLYVKRSDISWKGDPVVPLLRYRTAVPAGAGTPFRQHRIRCAAPIGRARLSN